MNTRSLVRHASFVTLTLALGACAADPGDGDDVDLVDSALTMPSSLTIVDAVASTSDGNGPKNAIDGKLSTRWSGEGSGATITFSLANPSTVTTMSLAWYRASERVQTFAISVSADGSSWKTVVAKRASKTSASVETFSLGNASAKFVRVTGYGNDQNDWNSLLEATLEGTAGSGSGTDAGAPGTDSGTPRSGITYPADLLDLSMWKLTLPVDKNGGTSGTAAEITQPVLHTYANAPWFTLNAAHTAVVFRANHGGATTSGSGNPRSELREMTPGGTTPASWSSTSGKHTLSIKEAITHLTNTKPQTVAGQIHDASDDITVFRLEGSNLWITDGNDTHAKLITSTYALGTVFTVEMLVSGGVITYAYNGAPVAGYSQKKSGSGWYFKVGDYTQSNPGTASDSDSAYAEVQVYDVRVTHE